MGKFTISCIAAAALSFAAFAVVVPTGSQAQTAAAPAPCGPVAYSAADQKYSGVPCTPQAQKTDAAGQPCGPVAYSAADQRYAGVPCASTPPKAEAGKTAPCGPVAYSAADQRTVVPCPQ
jgi:hypothetical protein